MKLSLQQHIGIAKRKRTGLRWAKRTRSVMGKHPGTGKMEIEMRSGM